jgi:hypothetical protein
MNTLTNLYSTFSPLRMGVCETNPQCPSPHLKYLFLDMLFVRSNINDPLFPLLASIPKPKSYTSKALYNICLQCLTIATINWNLIFYLRPHLRA